MLKIKKYRFIWVGIIVLGLMLLGIPTVYAIDQYVVDEVESEYSEDDLQIWATRSTSYAASGTVYVVKTSCVSAFGTLWRATGGGCSLQYAGARNGLEASRPDPHNPSYKTTWPTGWECRGKNYLSHYIQVTAHAICVRIR